MSAFDRLQTYSSRQGVVTDSVFDIKTPEGAFYHQVHANGYNLYEYKYRKDDELLSEDKYNWLSDDEKASYTKELCYTELYEFLKADGDLLVNAIAGSGKTTAITFKIIHDVVTGEATRLQSIPNGTQVRVIDKIWVCTFLRSGAFDLEQSVLSWQTRLGYTQSANQISFSTLDAEFKRCLNAMGVATNIGDPFTLSRLFKKAVDSCNITRKGYALTKEDYNIINSIVTYYRGRLDNKKYQHPSMSDYEITPSILDLIVNQYATLRKTEGIMDFEEMQELLYRYLYVTPNKNVQDFVAERYNYIYIDEFQDTSQMQYAILKFYARGRLWMNRSGEESEEPQFTGIEKKGKIIAVGDPSQCIYSFKGSDNHIIETDFDSDFRPSLCTLSVNWRCPSNILNPIVPSIHLNRGSASQKILPCRDGGEFFAYAFPSYKAMLEQLKVDIKADMDEGNSVAVLCRTNFDGMIPAFILESGKEFNFSISGENMTLNSPLPKSIIGVASLFTERSTPAVKKSLSFFVKRGAEWELKQLMDTLKANSMSIWQIPEADLRYSCRDIADFVAEVKPILMPDGITRSKEYEMSALAQVYWLLRTRVFVQDSAYAEAARAYIDTMLYLISNNHFDSVYDFLEEVDFLNDKLMGRIQRKKAPIQIATVHEFKGKEADSVYVWNDSDGVFPSAKVDISNEDEVEEERRVHYIACTRAKKKEHIYTLQGRVGMFAQEMNIEFENPIKISTTLNK